MNKQPESLRLADYLTDRNRLDLTCDEAAAELRRLHAVNEELLEALQVFAERSSSEEFITITVRTAYVDRSRAAIAKAEEKP